MSGTIRLTREIEDIRKNPPSNCSAQPVDDNIYHWKAQLFGPEGTPYAGGIFRLNILFPTNYPFKPPKINFETKVYHPNINSTGSICLDILKDKWSPALTINGAYSFHHFLMIPIRMIHLNLILQMNIKIIMKIQARSAQSDGNLFS